MQTIWRDIKKGKYDYIHKEKAREFLGRSGLQLPSLPNLNACHEEILTEKNLLPTARRNSASQYRQTTTLPHQLNARFAPKQISPCFQIKLKVLQCVLADNCPKSGILGIANSALVSQIRKRHNDSAPAA